MFPAQSNTKLPKTFWLAVSGLVLALGGLIAMWQISLPVQVFAQTFNDISSKFSPTLFPVTKVNIEKPPAAFSSGVRALDERAYVLDSYFKANNSPLYGTGELFVKACDKYGAPKDCTTVAAIARAETNLCKYYTSADTKNCWGFGGSPPNRMVFKTWEEGIDLVTRRLVFSYGIKYMIDPRKMERVFCGSEPGCTRWGARVLYFMKEISDYAPQVGLPYTLYDLR